MDHIVSNVPLVPQTLTNSCWYASTYMMIGWYRSRYNAAPPNTPETAGWLSVRMMNRGMPWAQFRSYAEAMGLRWFHQHNQRPTTATIAGWLQRHGPLMVDGVPLDAAGQPLPAGHVIVLYGVTDEGAAPSIWVCDPAPVNTGYRGRRPLSWLWRILSDADNPRRTVTFLHYPA